MNNNLSVVVVDDMQFSRMLIGQMLGKGNYTDIRTAKNGKEALALLEERRADVVLVDWEMPTMNGLEFTQTIRAQEEKSNWYTSIILITANQSPHFLEQAFLEGVDDFIYKPFQAKELLGRVYSAARIGRQHNELLAQTTSLLNARREQQELVSIDPLTQLYNRRQLRDQLHAVLEQIYARGGSACLCLIDLDKYDDIIANKGYQVGDEALVSLGNRIKQVLRPLDFLSRYWGGMFAVLIHSSNANIDFAAVIKRIQDEISDAPLETSAGVLPITCSAGAQVYEPNPTELSVNELELLALSHLNTAKQSGENGFHMEIKKGTF